MRQPSDAQSERESERTEVRFFLRLLILAIFAAFGAQGFSKTLAGLLAFAAIFCAVVAVLRREAALGHTDEAAAYTLVGMLLLHLA